MNKLALAVALGVGQGAWLSALAAGNVDQVRGEASVLSRDGQPRGLAKGDRVVQGETVVTGVDGEVLLATDDSGVLAVRPRSRLLIDNYKATGTSEDSVVLRLLRGGLRSITGWIGKTAPRNYRVVTPTATVGIRGTDHDIAVVEEGPDEGSTVNQVTTGQTTLSTSAGSINIDAGQVGAATSLSNPPQPLPAPPPGVFVPRATDARVGELKLDAEGQQEQRLRTRQQQNQRSGGASEQGNPRVSAQCAPGSPANQVLSDLLRAYERGDAAFLQRRLNPAMIGYGALLNEVLADNAAQRQTQVRVLDTQMQCSPDVAVIDFAWEKRYLAANDFTPRIERGRSSVLLTELGSGTSGSWQVSGLVGDNPFKPPVAVAASTQPSQLRASAASVSFANNPTGCTDPNAVVGVRARASSLVNVNITDNGQGAQSCAVGTFSVPCALEYINGIGSIVAQGPGTAALNNPQCTITSNGSFPGTLSTAVNAVAPVASAPVANNATTVAIPMTFTGSAQVGASVTYNVSVNINAVCSGNVLRPAPAPVCTGAVSQVPLTIEVIDPNQTTPSVDVQSVASNGDSRTWSLPRVSPGVYRITFITINRGAASVNPGNTNIDLVGATPGPLTLNLSYTDNTPLPGQAPQIRQASVVLSP
jgi:hypothetical protein